MELLPGHDSREGRAEIGGGMLCELCLELWVVLPVEHDPREGCAAMGGLGDLGVYWGPTFLLKAAWSRLRAPPT